MKIQLRQDDMRGKTDVLNIIEVCQPILEVPRLVFGERVRLGISQQYCKNEKYKTAVPRSTIFFMFLRTEDSDKVSAKKYENVVTRENFSVISLRPGRPTGRGASIYTAHEFESQPYYR